MGEGRDLFAGLLPVPLYARPAQLGPVEQVGLGTWRPKEVCMAVEIDDRGKRFTEQVHKIPTRVVIQTTHGRIEGMVHVHPEHRLSDELNQPTPFVAVTSATISEPEGNRSVPFVAVARNHVLWVIPVEGSGESHEQR